MRLDALVALRTLNYVSLPLGTPNGALIYVEDILSYLPFSVQNSDGLSVSTVSQIRHLRAVTYPLRHH
jgi:hypothetical protein